MQNMTSAYANKLLKSLEEDKTYWMNVEATSSTYVVALNEEPVIPEYDYSKVADILAEIDEKMSIIKHALNLANATAKVQVGNQIMSVDMILIRMAQLNKRKIILDRMRNRYVNYDLDLVKQEYEHISGKIMEMQMALDKYNQTEMFEVAM